MSIDSWFREQLRAKHSDNSRSVWMYVLRTSEFIGSNTKSVLFRNMLQYQIYCLVAHEIAGGNSTKEAIAISCLDVLLMNWEGDVLHEGRQILRCRQGATVASWRGWAAVASTEQETRSRDDGERGEEEPSWSSS